MRFEWDIGISAIPRPVYLTYDNLSMEISAWV